MVDLIDDYFNQGWKAFIRENQKRNARKNARMFSLLVQIKGQPFVDDLKCFMKAVDVKHTVLRVAREPKGILVRDKRFSTIPQLWVDQCTIEEGVAGSVFIQVKSNRWLKLRFSNRNF